MLKKIRTVLLFSLMLLIAACSMPVKSKNWQALAVSFAWEGNAGSLSSPNPKINVGNVPAGTAFLEVNMRDLQTTYPHRGGTVAHDGSGVIPVGALKDYSGPQPPAGQTHTYEFTVRALNADKSLILGEGSASRKYPE
jgi:hypothetical protein